jgi:hypothetical protein
MNPTLLKVISIALLFLGESVAIYAEVIAARAYGSRLFWPVFWKMFILMTVGGGFLIAGYMLGFKNFQDIWIVTVASITSILIMEPIINYSVFQELPHRGATVGLILGMLGLVATMIL